MYKTSWKPQLKPRWSFPPSPDSAHVARAALSRALVQNHGELHLVARLELQAVQHLFDVEEQLFAVAHLVRNESKLQEGKRAHGLNLRRRRQRLSQRNQAYLVLDTLHHSPALRNHITRHLLASLGNRANLELYKFSLLQTVSLVCHSHNSKGVRRSFSSSWAKQNKNKK